MGKALPSEEITIRCVQHVAIPDLATVTDKSVSLRYVINYVTAS